MHIEVQVALNFVISYLYNKLPRRRVNIFGEELEKALKERFQGHWYPDKPFKGSAFRCVKTGDPIDKVLERAARESGVPIQDILENLPQELAVWVDPGEVSYRIGEKGAVKILFSDKSTSPDDEHSATSVASSCADREVTRTFNPEAQCFRPIEAVGCSLSNLTLAPKSVTPFASSQPPPMPPQQQQQQQQQPPVGTQMPPAAAAVQLQQVANGLNGMNASVAAVPNQAMNPIAPSTAAPSPTAIGTTFKTSPSPAPAFIPRTTTPLTFTTATFAQTKFGSTKLKTNSKRANRMSPTEFSNYIKQRAMQQQIHQQPPPPHHSPGGRALSPDPASFYYGHGPYGPPFPAPRSMFESSSQFLAPDLYAAAAAASTKLPFDAAPSAIGPFYPTATPPVGVGGTASSNGNNTVGAGNQANNPGGAPQDSKLIDNWPYPASGQYQHLLVAN